MAFIRAIEKYTGLKAQCNMMPMQAGDVNKTWAHVAPFIKQYGYRPNTPLEKGVQQFIAWYKAYYKIDV